ncbi:MAG: cytidylate kinase-like family protein [Nitrospirae bacterium]|nr:MAG: cytidylate kinase-like family protein [Nitrospirota bacterium]
MTVSTNIQGYVRAAGHHEESETDHRFITISREYGSGGYAIGELMLQLLNRGNPSRPWQLYDRNLVDKIISDHGLSEELRASLEEHQVSKLEDWVGSVFEHKPPQVVLVEKTAITVRSLALRGRAIIMGRGGVAATKGIKGGLHVHLVAPLEDRISYTCRMTGEDRETVRKRTERIDREREEYVRAYYGIDLKDATNFHAVLNTSRLGFARTARTIVRLLEDLWGDRPCA